jgi:hypothetical protein
MRRISWSKNREQEGSQYQWLTSVIPATQEADIRRIELRSQPQGKQFYFKTLSRKSPSHTHKRLVDWLKWYHACLANMRP